MYSKKMIEINNILYFNKYKMITLQNITEDDFDDIFHMTISEKYHEIYRRW